MSRGQCCCACWNWLDDFNRAAIGSAWDAVAGGWSTVATNGDYFLREAGSADAVLVMAVDASPTPMKHRVSTQLSLTLAVGAKPRVIVNYVDVDNYFFAEWEKTDGDNNGTLRLFKRAGGANGAALASMPAQLNQPASLNVCFDSRKFAAALSQFPDETEPITLYICNPIRYPNGNKAGIGNGAAIVVDFADRPGSLSGFAIQEIWPPKADCPKCLCTCQGHCLPHTLLATIVYSTSGGCNLLAAPFPLVKAQGETNWKGKVLNICGVDDQDVVFGCQENLYEYDPSTYPPGDFVLKHDPDLPEGDCGYFVKMTSDDDNSTCSPLSIVLGPIPVTWGEGHVCLCCEEGEEDTAWVVVTEPPP